MKRTKLVEARRRKNWTLTDAAVHLCVDSRTVWRWEDGRVFPRAHSIAQLCATYGASAQELDLESNRANIDLSVDVAAIEIIQIGTNEIRTFIDNDVTMQLLSLAFLTIPLQELQDTMTNILDRNGDSVSRREALRRLIALPSISLVSMQQSSGRSPYNASGIIAQCAAGVAACREISKKSEDFEDIALAFRGVSSYLPILQNILRDSSSYCKQAASLASQCLRVKAMLAWHLENLPSAASYAREAVSYAREADDPSLLISTLITDSWVAYYNQRDTQSVVAMEEAAAVLGHTNLPKDLSVRVLSTQAVMQAKSGIGSSKDTLRLAHQALHSSPGSDHFAFSESRIPEIIGNEGMARYHLRDYTSAMNCFDQLIDPESLSSKMDLSAKARVEMLNFMALSSLKSSQKDLEITTHFWQAGIKGAKALKSQQRFRESLAIYDAMECVWPGERQILNLSDLTRHW